MSPRSAGSLVGTRLSNRYEIVSVIGRGGMGTVYLAHDPTLDRDVAIKVISGASISAEAEQRFRREARVVARMDHPTIVAVHDLGEQDGSLFFVMPLVRGTSLRTLLEERSLSLLDVLDAGAQTADALDYSHAQGVVHRDIKPENILVARDDNGAARVRVTDFGLAIEAAASRLTQTGTILGTVSYFSPEQVTQGVLDSRSDIYSLGTVLYECLTGATPFTGDVASLLYRIVNEPPPSPRGLGAEIDEELEALVLRCLAKDPESRPQRAGEIAEALLRYRRGIQESDRAWSFIGPAPTAPARRQTSDAFIGRTREIAELQRRLSAAVAGEAQLVLVAGEAGTGKSRLLDELARQARIRRLRVLRGRFVESESGLPYQGFFEAIQGHLAAETAGAEALADLADDLSALFPGLAEALGRPNSTGGLSASVAAPASAPEDRTQVFELLARTIGRIAAGRPLVLLLEDLHATGAAAAVDALEYVVRRLGINAALIVGSYRPSEIGRGHALTRLLGTFHGDRRFERIDLAPFTREEHRELVSGILGGARIEEAFIDELYEASEGNPYFARELVRAMTESVSLTPGASTGGTTLSRDLKSGAAAIPSTIQQTVEKRLAKISEPLREVLGIASVLGRSFDFRDLDEIAGREGVEGAVDALVEAGFLAEDRNVRGDRMTFASGVVRDVVYAAMPRRRRRALHRAHAERLEARHAGRLERVQAELVHHYRHAGAAECVVQHGLALARRSLDSFAGEEASSAARAVLEALAETGAEGTAVEGEARLLAARAARLAGRTDEALTHAEAALVIWERERLPHGVAEAAQLASEVAWEGRRVEETQRWIAVGLGAARQAGESDRLASLLALAATVANLRGEYEEARELLEEADRLQAEQAAPAEPLPHGGRLVVGLCGPVAARHPVEIESDEDAEVLANVFETLMVTGPQGVLLPALAWSWEESGGAAAFRFRLRPGAGAGDVEIGPYQVKQAFEHAISHAGRTLPPAFAAISGVTSFLGGETDEVTGLVAEYDSLVVNLIEPLPLYPALLTDPRTAVAIASEDGCIAGSGAFVLLRRGSRRLVLARSPEHGDAGTVLDEVEFVTGLSPTELAEGFQAGTLDLVSGLAPADLDDLLRSGARRVTLAEVPKKNVYFAVLKADGAATSNWLVRQALCGVVHSGTLAREALGRLAQPAEGLIPPGVLGHDPSSRRRPLPAEQASEMLRSAGVTLPLRLAASVHPVYQDRYAPLLAALLRAWEEIGVEVTIAASSLAAYVEANEVRTDGIDVVIGRWNADYDDPDSFAFGLFHSAAGRLRRFYSSPVLDRFIEAARAERDLGSREKLYRRVESHLAESGSFLPLVHDIDYRLAAATVRNLELASAPPFVSYAKLARAEPALRPVSAAHAAITVPLTAELVSLDPSRVIFEAQAEVLGNIFESLTREAEGARIVPWLASSFAVEERGRRYRFFLRDGVRFHDGRRVTARDVRFSYERVLADSTNPNHGLLSPIRGARALAAGHAQELEGFRIVSPVEFTIELEQPVAFFPALLASLPAAIVPEGSARFDASWVEGCVGTGPFRVAHCSPGRLIELEASPDYWRRDVPRAERLVFELGIPAEEIVSGFRAGRYALAMDLSPAEVETLRQDQRLGAQYRDVPRLSTYFMAFNTRAGVFADVELRRAFARGLAVEGMVRRHVGRLGVPAHGLIPPSLLGQEPARHASGHLGRAAARGMARGYVIPAYETRYGGLAEEIYAALRETGLMVELLTDIQGKTMRDLAIDEVDFGLIRWVADYPDPDTFVDGLLHTERGIIGAPCGSPEIDRLIELARGETSPGRRHAIYRQIEEIVWNQALLLPLFHEQTYCLARPEVEGFAISFFSRLVPYERLRLKR